MTPKQKFDLIKKNTAEIITEEHLLELLKEKKQHAAYCGYEPSGPIHLGHLVTIIKLLDLQKAGFKIKILLADIHALLNRKSSESLIKKEVENWKKAIKAIGVNGEIILGSDFQFKKEYQSEVMRLAQHTTINRGLRSMQEIARDIENATISQLWYPLMQSADIKHLSIDIALGGLEQRKVHMIAKDLSNILDYKFIAIHTPLITSLKDPKEKMSKSIPGSGISLTDTEDEIKKSINTAYCPPKETSNNPILQIIKLIIFPMLNKINIERPQKFGGKKTYSSYESLESDFAEAKLHPADLKSALFSHLENIIAPIRKNYARY